MPGTLYLVATPIGNLEDITLRALRVLGEVDLIACEDTRHTRKLLTHFEISKPLISCHEHNEHERAAELIARVEQGADIALVSDAGMPLISDPGFKIVSDAAARGIRIVPIPGPTAFVAAVAASGLPATEFVFAGFLPPKRGARRTRLEDFLLSTSTVVFYEAPHRIRQTLEDARIVLGDRPAALARELTKLHEEIIRGRLSEIATRVGEKEPRGEYVLVIGAAGPEQSVRATPAVQPGSILEAVGGLMETEGLDQKSALKQVARLRGISRRDAYNLMVAESKDHAEERLGCPSESN
ncbi:MAG TPA: 16S rRNA (cytidine(1402)-2'-O)-methyltransferase [Blastocatellia bacterium]|nr:16S rRNA (cytidine(1402)-2'-O)-methyltransferase [Blastocatellia bacterium]